MLGLESTSSRMGNLARQELYFKRFFSLDEMLESIERVTAEEVQELAQQFFDPQAHGGRDARPPGGFRVRREDLSYDAAQSKCSVSASRCVALLAGGLLAASLRCSRSTPRSSSPPAT